MDQIIECVPNVSEGRDKTIITKLASSIESVEGVRLLHIDIGESANRTVFTFAGSPVLVVEAAFNLIKASSVLIDMGKHTGTHPRIGAVDVCPLIPVSGISMEETMGYADSLARRVGNDLNLPVYLYAKSALKDNRAHLENIRHGEYESLPEKLKMLEWLPDYGPAEFIPHFGAIVIGARDYLIAFNVNLDTENVGVAKIIAGEIRESGRKIRGNGNGQNLDERIPGLLKDVKAIGWYEERYNCAQVSVNILNYNSSPIEKVFNTISNQAKNHNCKVTGSEIIGLVPLSSVVKELSLKKYRLMDENIEKEIKIFEKKTKIVFLGVKVL
jgi:glutamate formiminotransferase/formiminotetrahydrofolate cyclodeaminase